MTIECIGIFNTLRELFRRDTAETSFEQVFIFMFLVLGTNYKYIIDRKQHN